MTSPGIGYYLCGRHILLANAKAYHIYDEEFRKSQRGRIGIVLSMDWGMPSKADSKDDQEAVEAYIAFNVSLFRYETFDLAINDRCMKAATLWCPRIGQKYRPRLGWPINKKDCMATVDGVIE